jgi:tetratricopeptide (TPR) repeat protein
MDTDKKPQEPPLDEWADATTAFQKLLEVMPEDMLALESLFEAHLKMGQVGRAVSYLDRLIRVLVKEDERGIAAALHEKIVPLSAELPELAPYIAQLEPLLRPGEEAPAVHAEPPPTLARGKADIQAELVLAWRLFQAGELAQEDYARVVQDLTDVSTRKADVPVTVLHALHDRNFKGLDKVMTRLSKDSGLPIIALSSFEIPHSVHTLLPIELMSHWGAIVFDVLGSDLLIAVLNPFDQVLQTEVAVLTGRTCHFYLVSASDYDKTLAHIRKTLAEVAQAT